MNEKKETKGGIVGMLAIACVIAAMLMPPSKTKSGSSLGDEREVPEWKIPIKEKDPKLALEDQDFFSQDSLMEKVVKRVREKRPLLDRPIFTFHVGW
jgi:lipoprotein